jgi:hypothetical protein
LWSDNSSKKLNLPIEFAIASKTRIDQYSRGKSGKSIWKLLFLKFSRRGLNLGSHLFSIRTPFPKIQGEPKMHRRSLSERKKTELGVVSKNGFPVGKHPIG